MTDTFYVGKSPTFLKVFEVKRDRGLLICIAYMYFMGKRSNLPIRITINESLKRFIVTCPLTGFSVFLLDQNSEDISEEIVNMLVEKLEGV